MISDLNIVKTRIKIYERLRRNKNLYARRLASLNKPSDKERYERIHLRNLRWYVNKLKILQNNCPHTNNQRDAGGRRCLHCHAVGSHVFNRLL